MGLLRNSTDGFYNGSVILWWSDRACYMYVHPSTLHVSHLSLDVILKTTSYVLSCSKSRCVGHNLKRVRGRVAKDAPGVG
jgi:hypothetical protein